MDLIKRLILRRAINSAIKTLEREKDKILPDKKINLFNSGLIVSVNSARRAAIHAAISLLSVQKYRKF